MTSGFLGVLSGCYWPILLKKSAMVFSAEKYAREIEFFTLSRGVGAQISRSDVHKRRFQRSAGGQSGKTDFFNRIGRFLPVTMGRSRPKADGGDRQKSASSDTRRCLHWQFLLTELVFIGSLCQLLSDRLTTE
jgi:hypothetical protein